ncbi:hypothetical protein E1091_06865 [Micromonospora fluostatini]|uniref:Uncharacterized protein n=1 Tax=Micromonospora fluostatini TaxID=1629071 RepID=A0ABY2DIL8_9ACTN|nr:hypothetical protein E1091_06865 [Micromonospora fluostatini]
MLITSNCTPPVWYGSDVCPRCASTSIGRTFAATLATCTREPSQSSSPVSPARAGFLGAGSGAAVALPGATNPTVAAAPPSTAAPRITSRRLTDRRRCCSSCISTSTSECGVP